jgi:hypothetical protein
MNKYIETLKKFYKVIELSKTIEIECPICKTKWVAPKNLVHKGMGILRMLDHEYSHKK